MRRAAGRRWSLIPVLAVVALCAMFLFAARAAYGEWQVKRMEADEDLQLSAGDGRAPDIGALADRTGLPPRASLMRAEMLARDAFALRQGLARSERIRQARASLSDATAGRSRWGDALIVAAFIDFVQYGAAAPVTHASLERSYRILRFSRRSGVWRVRLGINQWASLNPATRRHVIEEAVWLGNLSLQHDSLMRSIIAEAPMALNDYFATRQKYMVTRDDVWRQ